MVTVSVPGASYSGTRNGVRVGFVIVDDRGTKKSSLIKAAAPVDFYPDLILSPGTSHSGRRNIAGDRGTGKSNLIEAETSKSFPESVRSVLALTRLPADFYLDLVPVAIIYTTSRSKRIKIMRARRFRKSKIKWTTI